MGVLERWDERNQRVVEHQHATFDPRNPYPHMRLVTGILMTATVVLAVLNVVFDRRLGTLLYSTTIPFWMWWLTCRAGRPRNRRRQRGDGRPGADTAN